jgi:hypothetical protein
MSNVFKQMAENTRPILLFAWPLGVVLVLLSVVLMMEDYATSRAGYEMLPTLKVNNGWVTLAVAALPQVGQIVLFYIFGRDTKKGWAALLASIFFLADLSTDAWFKSGGAWNLMPLAIVESLFIFTLGSEVLFTIAVGFVAETFPEFIITSSAMTKAIMNALQTGLEALGIGDGNNGGGNNRQY